MHPDLEALIQAYDAALEAAPKDAAHRKERFEERLQDVLARTVAGSANNKSRQLFLGRPEILSLHR